jgi:glutaconate CoA-transferase subunit B
MASCARTALTTVSVPEIFRYWLQGGRVSVGFLSGAQVDAFGNLNTTVIGSYDHPRVRLPGGGGAPEIAISCGEIFIVMRHHRRSFVARLDFVTSLGHGRGRGERERLGVNTKGPTLMVTDLCVMRPDALKATNWWSSLSIPASRGSRYEKAQGGRSDFPHPSLPTLPPTPDSSSKRFVT